MVFPQMKKICGNLFVILLLSICICSCAVHEPCRMYDGDPLPENQIARVVTQLKGKRYKEFVARAKISSIDGVEVPSNSTEFELLPGMHSLDVGFYTNETQILNYMHFDLDYPDYKHYISYSSENDTVRFFAQPGHTYLVVIKFSQDSPTNFTADHFFYVDVIDVTDIDS